MTDTPARPKVVLALIHNEGKFLLIKRRTPMMKVEWAFPGGVTEENETDLEAAIRESRQEVGLDVIALEKLFERKHPNTFVQISYVSCEPKGELNPIIGEPEEISEVEWVEASEVLTRFTSDVHPMIRSHILSFVRAEEV